MATPSQSCRGHSLKPRRPLPCHITALIAESLFLQDSTPQLFLLCLRHPCCPVWPLGAASPERVKLLAWTPGLLE
jgi:hypothetical protein